MLDPAIFKANDIRGIVDAPEPEWDEQGAAAVGAAYAEVLGPGATCVVSRDMRSSGPAMSSAFIRAVLARGVNVLDAGLASTDQLWFASGWLGVPGVQFTASHNPGEYNGIKFCRTNAQPVDAEFMTRLHELARSPRPVASEVERGQLTQVETLVPYAEHLRALVPLDGIRPLRVVVDAGNGMAGYTAEAVLANPLIEVIGLYMDLDGSFPNHAPNPLEPANLVDAQAAVRAHQADLGLVFDGDADRCFIIDERGEVVEPSLVTAMIARQELAREPGGVIVINKITSRAVSEVVAECGGTVVVSKVGHTYVKALMAEHGAVFGGEHSAHYYFREFWGADTGMLAALQVLSMVGRATEPVSVLADRDRRYLASGELNSSVADAATTMQQVAVSFADRGTADWDDGLTVEGLDSAGEPWWFNLRPSNTEPLLRLNVEARRKDTLEQVRDEVLALVRHNE